jgi:hypothetical protein
MPKIPRIKPKPKPPKCRICASPQRNAINQRIVRGDSIQSIAKDFGCCRLTMMRHAGVGNDKNGVPHKAHYVSQVTVAKARMDGKAGLDLLTCQEEVYNLSIRAAKIALGDEISENKEVKPDIRAFGSCLGPAAKVVEVLARVAPNNPEGTESDDYLNAVRETAKSDWKDARAIQVEAAEPETEAGT